MPGFSDDARSETTPLRVVPAASVPFADVEAVFGTRGDPARCWCQWYKIRGAEWRETTPEALRGLLAAQLADSGPGPGLLAYDGDTPVGWCAIEPRPALVRLPHSPVGSASPDDFGDPGVWSVSCFVIPRAFRRRGVATALASAAVEFARANGARVVEAYAVDPSMRAKASAAELFPGTVSMFTEAGFVEVARPKPHRIVMQLRLDP